MSLTVRDARPPPGAALVEFGSPATELEEECPPRAARLMLYAILGLIAAGILWSSLTRIDEVAVAPGKLITSEANILIQPLENAVVRSVNVHVGETVTAGQVLAVLDPTFTEADVTQIRSRFSAADAMVRRLEAELAGEAYRPSDRANPDALLEERLAGQRSAFRESRLRNLDEEIALAETRRANSHREEEILIQRLDGVRDLEAMRSELFEHKTGSRFELIQTRDTRLDVEAAIARARGEQDEAAHEVEKARSQRKEFLDDFARASLEALVAARASRAEAEEDLKKAELRRSMVSLTAPVDAVVLEIAPRSVGSVMRQAEPLFSLVPLDAPLEAEVAINARDIGEVRVGQDVRIKLTAFPFQRYGTLAGTVRTISRDAFSDKDGAPGLPDGGLYYRARIALSETGLHGVPGDFALLPGMAVQAEVNVGSRRVIAYFLDPILKGFDEAMHEP
jgi:HlyD family secretion protein